MDPSIRKAAVFMLGSLCPVTNAHIRCFEEANALLRGPKHGYVEVRAFVSLNSDHHVASKLAAKGHRSICAEDRRKLIELSIAHLPWLQFSADADKAQLSAAGYHVFELNGGDDVIKYRKWRRAGPNKRYITMVRPGTLDDMVCGLVQDGLPDCGNDYFIIGPELEDISSSLVREASSRGDRDALLRMVHPAVCDWMLRRYGHGAGGGACAALGTAGVHHGHASHCACLLC